MSVHSQGYQLLIRRNSGHNMAVDLHILGRELDLCGSEEWVESQRSGQAVCWELRGC